MQIGRGSECSNRSPTGSAALNTDAIADMALENYVEMRSTVREPKFQLKKDLSFRLEERHPGRFIPRYSMVMFHTIPYAEAKRRGAIQEQILDELDEPVPRPSTRSTLRAPTG